MADVPSIDAWLREAKADPSFRACGMYLVHNGIVRETPKAEARGIETDGVQPGDKVTGMVFVTVHVPPALVTVRRMAPSTSAHAPLAARTASTRRASRSARTADRRDDSDDRIFMSAAMCVSPRNLAAVVLCPPS